MAVIHEGPLTFDLVTPKSYQILATPIMHA